MPRHIMEERENEVPAKVAPAGQASAARLARHRALMGLSGSPPPAAPKGDAEGAGAAMSSATDLPTFARANGGDESQSASMEAGMAAKKAAVIVLVWRESLRPS